MHRKITIICGPTAVGKTGVGIELAQRFNGEIVSADSGQVWRGFDIGTAKPSAAERAKVPNHLIDVVDPDDHFDASLFVRLADTAIADITSRGRTVFVVGGTGMYIRMLLHGFCDAPPQDRGLRAELEREIKDRGLRFLHDKLRKCDPETASHLHPNDRTRIVRALEIFELTNLPASHFQERHRFKERRYDAVKIGLNIERSKLYRRIDERVDRMIESGFVEEVRILLQRFDESCQPFSAVGYKEFVDYLKGRIEFPEAVRLIKQNTRRFAKRQLTWFRADAGIGWFTPGSVDKVAVVISSHLQ